MCKKTAAVLLICALLSANVTCSADGAAVSVGSADACAGAYAEAELMLYGCEGFANLGLEISYDKSVMCLTGVTANPSVGTEPITAQLINANPFNICWNSASNICFNGTLATLKFKIQENAPDGSYPVAVSFYRGRNGTYVDGTSVNYDEDYKSLGLTYQNGSITVGGELKISLTVNQKVYSTSLSASDGFSGNVVAALYDGSKMTDIRLVTAEQSLNITLNGTGSTVRIMRISDTGAEPLSLPRTLLIK